MTIYEFYRRFKYYLGRIFGILTKEIRILPDFIIIGGMRSGNSTLYKYITQHPYIRGALRQEIHFFDLHFNKGINWYRSFFPTLAYKFLFEYFFKHKFITGEATPLYLFYPRSPARTFSLLPNVKIFIILRNPTDRAYAHYLVYKRNRITRGVKYLSYEEFIERAINKYNEGLFDFERDNHLSFSTKDSVFARGIYVDQIKRWLNYFPREQIMILKSEALFNDPHQTLKRVYKFLGLPYWNISEYKNYGKKNYTEMDSKLKKKLFDLYEPHNQRLYQFLDENYNWHLKNS